MILSWRNSATRQFAESGKNKFSGMDAQKARVRLAALARARSLADLGALQSVGLHKLTGDRSGFWAITINGPWRIIFRFEDGNAQDVEMADYH